MLYRCNSFFYPPAVANRPHIFTLVVYAPQTNADVPKHTYDNVVSLAARSSCRPRKGRAYYPTTHNFCKRVLPRFLHKPEHLFVFLTKYNT